MKKMIKFKGVKIKERMKVNMKKQNSRQARESESIKKWKGENNRMKRFLEKEK